MRRLAHFAFAFSALLFLFATITPSAPATITTTGNVEPDDPSMWTGSTMACIGNTSDGTLTVDGGSGLLLRSGYLGYDADVTGTVTVSGNGSTWNSSSGFYIGLNGNGALNITDHGMVNNGTGIIAAYDGSTGTVTVSGANSAWTNHSLYVAGNPRMNPGELYVGNYGTGELNITDGGKVQVFAATWLGPSGSIHFDNGTLNAGWLHAGSSQLTGIGTINTNGLIADGIDFVLDKDHGMQQTFTLNDLPGQNIAVNLDFDDTQGDLKSLGAGYTGDGSLTIRDGISVESYYGHVGRYSGSHGTVTVSGAGSQWISSRGLVCIGCEGDGELNITDGGVVDNTSLVNITIGYAAGSTGTVNVSGIGSKWIGKFEGIDVGRDGTGHLNISQDGLVKIERTLTIDVNLDGDSFINMSTGGMLALKGEADDSLTAFLDLVQGTDAIRWWDDSIDDWALLTTATRDTDYTLEYLTDGDLAGYTLLTVGTAPVPGDANGDGRVDGSDVTILAGNWQVGVDDGQTATRAMGDFNADGRVDGSDVTILAGNWQYGVTTPAAAVPEPSTLALLLILFSLICAKNLRMLAS